MTLISSKSQSKFNLFINNTVEESIVDKEFA